MRLTIIILSMVIGCGKVAPREDSDDDPAPICTAGAMLCGDDGGAYQCDADGNGKTKIMDCAHGCSAGACNTCTPGMLFCTGEDLSACDATGHAESTASCMGHGCQMDRCNTCTPDDQYCSGNSAITCDVTGMPGPPKDCGANGCIDGICNVCVPNTTSCVNDSVVVCKADGTVASKTPCALGCTTTTAPPRCVALAPSYGSGAPIGVGAFDLLVNDVGTIDVTGCTSATGAVNVTVGNVTTKLTSPRISFVAQAGATAICVVKYRNITISAGQTLTIVNGTAGQVVALEAEGAISIAGTVRFRSSGVGGARGADAAAVAVSGKTTHVAPGGGGGGNAIAGGKGGACVSPVCGTATVNGGLGGGVLSPAVRLFAGGKGGDVTFGTPATALGLGGRGGGGLQLVALTSIAIGASAVIDLTGEGGAGLPAGSGSTGDLPAGGGGAGGTLVIETPQLVTSAGAVLSANGGGGGGGCFTCVGAACTHASGQSGPLASGRAAPGTCSSGGNGGFGASGAANPSPNAQDTSSTAVAGGGGGGGDGIIILRGRDAAHLRIAAGTVISPQPTLGSVTTN